MRSSSRASGDGLEEVRVSLRISRDIGSHSLFIHFQTALFVVHSCSIVDQNVQLSSSDLGNSIHGSLTSN